jgi:hypothetical protein
MVEPAGQCELLCEWHLGRIERAQASDRGPFRPHQQHPTDRHCAADLWLWDLRVDDLRHRSAPTGTLHGAAKPAQHRVARWPESEAHQSDRGRPERDRQRTADVLRRCHPRRMQPCCSVQPQSKLQQSRTQLRSTAAAQPGSDLPPLAQMVPAESRKAFPLQRHNSQTRQKTEGLHQR